MRDERRLARRAARGDRDAFTAIFRRFGQDLYRYCVAILGNPEDAQDALQNTMVKALGALPGERREIELKPWLYRIAHNESIDLIRRRRQSVPLVEEVPLSHGATLAEEVETRQRLRQLIADVGELPERQRGALLMREAGGLEFGEIAAALGTTPAVARQTLYEARLGLREMDAGRNMECTAVTKALSDGDRRTRRRRDIGAHLKGCEECRLFAAGIDSRQRALASISPLPAIAAAALLQGLGGAGAGAGAGVAAGAGAGKAIGTATLLKGAATIAAAAAIGVGGADVAGLVHTGTPGGDPKAEADAAEAPVRMGDPEPQAIARTSARTTAARANPTPVGRDRPARASDIGRSRGLPSAAPSSPGATPPEPAPPASPAVTLTEPAATATAPAEPAPSTPVPAPEPTAPAPPPKPAAEHPRGPDHPKELPPSAAHGQEMAAAAKEKPRPPKPPKPTAEPETGAPPAPPTPTTDATEDPPPPAEEVETEAPGKSGTAPGREGRP